MIVIKQLKQAEAISAKIIKKRNIKVKYITQRESLTIKEAIELSQEAIVAVEVAQSGSGDAIASASARAPRHCSGCGSTEHNARTCPTLKEASKSVLSI